MLDNIGCGYERIVRTNMAQIATAVRIITKNRMASISVCSFRVVVPSESVNIMADADPQEPQIPNNVQVCYFWQMGKTCHFGGQNTHTNAHSTKTYYGMRKIQNGPLVH